MQPRFPGLIQRWVASMAVSFGAVSCGAPAGQNQNLEALSSKARSFNGLTSLTRTADRTFMLRWKGVDDRLATYGIFKTPEGEEMDFGSAPFETTTNNYFEYIPEDPSGEAPLCFSVRVISTSGDENTSQFCTPDTREEFKGVDSITRQEDGTYVVSWEKVNKEVNYLIFRNNKDDVRRYDSPLGIVESNFWETILPERGTAYCFSVILETDLDTLVEGEALPEICTEDEEPLQFGGVKLIENLGNGKITLHWDNPKNPEIVAFQIYVGSGLEEPFRKAAGDQSSITIEGLTPDRQYDFVVRAQDSYGREDNNLVVRAVIPLN